VFSVAIGNEVIIKCQENSATVGTIIDYSLSFIITSRGAWWWEDAPNYIEYE